MSKYTWVSNQNIPGETSHVCAKNRLDAYKIFNVCWNRESKLSAGLFSWKFCGNMDTELAKRREQLELLRSRVNTVLTKLRNQSLDAPVVAEAHMDDDDVYTEDPEDESFDNVDTDDSELGDPENDGEIEPAPIVGQQGQRSQSRDVLITADLAHEVGMNELLDSLTSKVQYDVDMEDLEDMRRSLIGATYAQFAGQGFANCFRSVSQDQLIRRMIAYAAIESAKQSIDIDVIYNAILAHIGHCCAEVVQKYQMNARVSPDPFRLGFREVCNAGKTCLSANVFALQLHAIPAHVLQAYMMARGILDEEDMSC